MKCYDCATLNGAGIACKTSHVRILRIRTIILMPLSKRNNEPITCACGCGVIGCKTEE